MGIVPQTDDDTGGGSELDGNTDSDDVNVVPPSQMPVDPTDNNEIPR